MCEAGEEGDQLWRWCVVRGTIEARWYDCVDGFGGVVEGEG